MPVGDGLVGQSLSAAMLKNCSAPKNRELPRRGYSQTFYPLNSECPSWDPTRTCTHCLDRIAWTLRQKCLQNWKKARCTSSSLIPFPCSLKHNLHQTHSTLLICRDAPPLIRSAHTRMPGSSDSPPWKVCKGSETEPRCWYVLIERRNTEDLSLEETMCQKYQLIDSRPYWILGMRLQGAS